MAAKGYRVSGIKHSKFHVPLLPQQNYVIGLSENASASLNFTVHHDRKLIASGVLQLNEVHHAHP
jgi:hypothetical protein